VGYLGGILISGMIVYGVALWMVGVRVGDFKSVSV
jgi:hypothetical protein